MRTIIRLDEHLVRDAKELAARTGRTLTGVIEDALRELLARSTKWLRRAPVALPTFRGDGLRPGVNLDDSAGLIERMERPGDHDRRRPGAALEKPL